MKKKPLSRVSPVQYSPRRQSRWVLADYGGRWKRFVEKVSFEPGMKQWMCDGGWQWWNAIVRLSFDKRNNGALLAPKKSFRLRPNQQLDGSISGTVAYIWGLNFSQSVHLYPRRTQLCIISTSRSAAPSNPSSFVRLARTAWTETAIISARDEHVHPFRGFGGPFPAPQEQRCANREHFVSLSSRCSVKSPQRFCCRETLWYLLLSGGLLESKN